MAKPKNLKEYYQQQQAIFQPIRNVLGPDYKDVENVTEKDIEGYILDNRIAEHRENQVKNNIVNALQTLSDDQLRQVYGKIKGPNADESGTEKDFIEKVRKGWTSALNPDRYGSTVDTMMDVFGEALGKDKVDGIINTPIQLYPGGPEYQSSKVYEPYANDIQKLRDRYTKTDDPEKNRQAAELLDRVSVSLQEVKPEVLAEYDGPRTRFTVEGYANYEDIVGRRVDIMRKKGLDTLGDGAFKDLVKPRIDDSGSPDFNVLEDSEYPVPMTEEQEKKLDELSKDKNVGLSEDTRRAVRELSQCMDELDYSIIGMPLSGQMFPPHKPTKEGENFFQAEQGEKYYAFWPLEAAKRDLVKAVKEGDLDKVRQAQEKYEKVEKTIDKCFTILKSDKLFDGPLFAPNVESTRASTGDLPEKYALDTTNQKKLNCIFMTYAQLKNAGMTMEDLVDDPTGTAKKLGKSMLEAGGLDSRQGSIGATLQNGMKGSFLMGSADRQLHYAWTTMDSGTHRGISGIIGMEKDLKRRGEFMAAFHLGMRSATKSIKEEKERYKTMSNVSESKEPRYIGMKATIYQNATLRPETGNDRFDLKKMVDNFNRPDRLLDPNVPLNKAKPEQIRYSWQDDMDAANKIADGTGNYDWKNLAGRNKKVIEDAAREEKISGSYKNKFYPDDYLLNAFAAQSRLVKNAEAHGENSPEFQEFKQSVKNTYELADSNDKKVALKIGAELLDNPEAYNFLRTGKSDQFITTDSDEYKKMKRSLALVQKSADYLTGGDPMKIEAVSNSDIAKYLDDAKQDAFDYVRLKLKNGTKTSFHYKSGEQRAKEGLTNYRKLAALQDKLGLRSPAQKVYEDAREELLLRRSDERWLMSEAGRNALAKMLYAKPFIDAKIPAEHQTTAFTPENLKRNVDRIRDRSLAVFQAPAEIKDLADDALKNSGRFKEFVDHGTAGRKESYSKIVDRQVRQDCAKGYALDEAARQLKLTAQSQTYDERNPELQRKADEIMKDPEFRDIMLRLMDGKTIKQIKALHERAKLDSDPGAQSHFDKAKRQVRFEKRCASVTAEAMLRSKNPDQEPTKEAVKNTAEALLKDARFSAFVREKESAFESIRDFENATNDLNVPEKRNQFLSEMSKRVTEPIPQAEAPKAGHEQQILNEGPAAQQLIN